MWGLCKLGSGVNVENVNLGHHQKFGLALCFVLFFFILDVLAFRTFGLYDDDDIGCAWNGVMEAREV